MMLQRTTNSEREASVARLTPKERECLDRWLGHATAKEIALDLGITHHAVEKRLKSARAKLGVTSTLEAARLLAAAQGYGQAVSQPPEVGEAATQNEDMARPSTPPWWKRRPGLFLSGASIMSLFLLAALAFQPAPGPAPANQKVVVLNSANGSSTDLATALGGVFAKLDKNGDGFIAGVELDGGRFQVTRTTIAKGGSAPAPTATRLVDFDSSGDGRVSEGEFRDGMAKLTRPRT